MRQATKTKSVERLDPVWNRIREEAEDIARHEPVLGGFIFASILNHDSFEQALIHRLAQRLGNADLGADLVVQAFADALDAEPEIGNAARADIVATFERDPACHRYADPLLYFKGYQSIQTYRMAHRLWHMGRKDFAYYLQSRTSIVASMDIHPAARIGKGIMVDHGHDIVIGETSVIEDNVSIMQGVTLGGTGKEAGDRHPKIRYGVLVGAGAKILGNIEIGSCSRVAACSVVLHDVPPNTTVAGVPAKVVGYAGCSEPALVMDHNVEPVAGSDFEARPHHSPHGDAVLKPEEIAKLTKFLRAKFENPALAVKKRPQKDDSGEVYIGEEFIGVIFRDEEDGELSYNFSMAILDFDLE